MLSWRENVCTHVVCVCVCVCAERKKCQTEKTVKKCTKMYCQKYNVGLCIGQCFEVYHTKLNHWEEKKQLIFRGSATETVSLCDV